MGLDVAPGSVPFPTVALWSATLTYTVFVALYLVVLPLIFPDGNLLSRRWRWVLLGLVATVAASIPAMFAGAQLPVYAIANPLHIAALDWYGASPLSMGGITFMLLGLGLVAWVSTRKRSRRPFIFAA
jgi:hypothetical protein